MHAWPPPAWHPGLPTPCITDMLCRNTGCKELFGHLCPFNASSFVFKGWNPVRKAHTAELWKSSSTGESLLFTFFSFLNKVRLQLIILFTVEVTEKSFTPYSPLNLFFSYSHSPPPLRAFNKPQEYKSEKKPKSLCWWTADKRFQHGWY